MSDQPAATPEQPTHRFSNREEVRKEVLELAKKSVSLTLAQKILKIGKAAGVVKKKGKFGSEMGGSSYLRIEDAVVAVGKLMADEGLILTPTLAKRPDGTYYFEYQPHQPKGYISSVVMDWTLEDVETKESRTYSIPGAGYDGTDKGVYKAETGSRKYAIINIFNLPVGNDVEANNAAVERELAKAAQQDIAGKKIAQAAAKGQQSAIDAMSQDVPANQIKIGRPEEYNGHFIKVSGFLAPQLQQYFSDTAAKHFPAKGGMQSYWRLSSEYETGLIKICEKLGIEVEG